MSERKYQTGFKRLLAAIVDGIVFMPLLLVDSWILDRTNDYAIIFSWIAFSGFLPVFYSIFLHYRYGQTIGKWVVGVQVLDISEIKKMTLAQSIIRDCFYFGVQVLGLAYFLFLLYQIDYAEEVYTNYNNFIQMPILWWTVIELISMLTNYKRRAVHDFLARSVVIRS